ncbi:MAG: nucleoside deaminase [Acidobacteria bacterium]|nr:nucleoside deaminase [Acidobacteriota bacterium]
MENQFLKRAIELAIENVKTRNGGPFGAVVVRDGEIVAEGVNLVTTSLDPTAHAEVVAIRRACQHLQCFELKGCEIYTSCEPCPMCLAAIYWARAERVVFGAGRKDAAEAGFDDEFLYKEIQLEPGARSLPLIQSHREEALAALDLWREDYGKIRY